MPSAASKWANFLRRLLALRHGRYIITLTNNERGVFWTLQEMGDLEK